MAIGIETDRDPREASGILGRVGEELDAAGPEPRDVGVQVLGGETDPLPARAAPARGFTRAGAFLHAFGADMSSAWGLAVNSREHIVVADCAGRCVHICQVDGTLLHTIKPFDYLDESVGTYEVHFLCPEYVAVNSKDEIIVSDIDLNCMKVFNSEGAFVGRLGAGGKREGQFYVPCGVCVDEEDNIYCADYNNRRVQFLSAGAGELSRVLLCGVRAPQAVAVRRGKLVVVHRGDISVYQLPPVDLM